ncbi:unnamed protein product [Rodentolepis nana]|uniref:Annexin n=1 Tax=Rodentolepis nana TaxID=102285 RepID=A0A0R3T1X0_RODNA|nr:unnamed protein product [Rodentolepis nana]
MRHDYNADADRIQNACKGLGTKEDDLIEVIGKRKLAERHQIRLAYYSKYKKDLLEVLDSELSGDFGNLTRNLFLGPIQVMAYDLFKIIKKSGSAGTNVNDIICVLSPTEITALKAAYADILAHEGVKDKTRTLEKDIEKDTKGGHCDFLLKFMSNYRPEFSPETVKSAALSGNWEGLVDKKQIERYVAAIHAAGGGKAGKGNETEVTRILCSCSTLDIRAIYDHFKDVYNVSLVDYITKAFKNPLRDAYNTVIMTAVDLRLLLVAQLYNSMRGLGTDERALSRIICIRSEIDLPYLKMLYQQKIGKSLSEAIKSDTSGDYRSLLLTLLGEK